MPRAVAGPREASARLAVLAAQRRVYSWAGATVLAALVIAAVCINPLWERYRPPFAIPHLSPAIMAPVDGPFYVRNAQVGYRWRERDPLSLSYHPLLSLVLRVLPQRVPLLFWFFLLCVLSGCVALVFVYDLTTLWMPAEEIPRRAIPFLLVMPAGLIVATGSPELPALLLHAVVFLAVLRWKKGWIAACAGVAAILVKPNALYLVPALLVYATRDGVGGGRAKRALLAVGGILIGWLAWILYVGWRAGAVDAYWSARVYFDVFDGGRHVGFFEGLVRSFLDRGNIRDQVRYSSALIIPLANMWIAGTVQFADERDRSAVAISNAAMLAMAVLLGNPNKIIVYALTIPGNLSIHWALAWRFFRKIRTPDVASVSASMAYSAYCAAMMVVFVWGTAVGWYF